MRRFGLALLVLTLPTSLPSQEDKAKPAKEKPILVLDPGGHTAHITGLFFTPDGKRLVSTSTDKTVRVWDVASGETIRTVRLPLSDDDDTGLAGGIQAAALYPKGNILAVAGPGMAKGSHIIYRVNLDTGRLLTPLLRSPGQGFHALAVSPDAHRLAAGGAHGAVRVWDIRGKAKEPSATIAAHTGTVHGLAFSPDGKRLASAGNAGLVRIWSLPAGKQEAELKGGHKGMIRGLAWSPNGKTLASWGHDGHLCLWNANGSLRKRLRLEGAGYGLAFSADSRRLLLKDAVFDVAGGKLLKRFERKLTPTLAVALSPDGRRAAWGGPTRLYLWNTADGKTEFQLGHGEAKIAKAAWRPDGEGLAWRHSGRKNDPDEFHWRSFELARLALGGPPDPEYPSARHALRGLTLEVSAKRQLVVKRGKDIVQTLKVGDLIHEFTFLDDKRVAVGGARGAYLFDVATGAKLRAFKGAGSVHGLAPSADNRWLVTGGIDRTLRVWSPDRERPVLLLFALGNDWIAWTPEGYYAASPGGERLMGWQVNRGPAQAAAFHPAAQFRKSLYRPDVVARVLEAGDTRKALALADKESGKATQLTEVEDVLPPTVAIVEVTQVEGKKAIPITAETGAVEVAGEKVVVRALADSGGKHAVKEMLLLLDGRPYRGRRGFQAVADAPVGDVERKWDVVLTPGAHQLAVVARSGVSSAVSPPVEVVCLPKGQPVGPVGAPTLHTLFIGVNEYKGQLKLDFAVNDAQGLSKTLLSGSRPLFKQAPPRILTDAEMTPARVFKELDELKKDVKQKDLTVIFYAGHGYQDKAGRFYMLPIGMDIDNLEKTGVPGDKLKEALAELPGRTLLIIDACHGGKQKGLKGGGWTLKPQGPTDGLARDLADDDCGVVVMCAAMGHEESREDAAAQHGYFTLALIEALSGKADYNGDGTVGLSELQLYVERRVAQLSRDSQHPVTARPSSVRSFTLAKLGGK